MSLSTLLDTLMADLPAGIGKARGGLEEVFRAGAPPRVIFDFTTESIEPPHGQGSGRARSHWLCTRAADVDIHIWGEDLAKTEELVELVLNILQERCPGDSHRRRGARWQPKGGALSYRGYVYVLGVTFLLPVERREEWLRLQQLPITGEVQHGPA